MTDETRGLIAAHENRLLNIARGCHDYGGGHHNDGMMDAYQHGISTVVAALEAALKHDPNDHQVNTLEVVGLASRRDGKE